MNPTERSLAELFASLDENTTYVILRNYDGLPEAVGNDVDILADDGDEFEETLRAMAEEGDWLLRKRIDRYAFRSYQLMRPSEGKPVSVKIDTWFPLTWKGIEWIDSDYVLNNRERHPGGFYIPPPGAEAATLLLKDLLQHGEVQQRYRDRIQELVEDDEDGFETGLTSKFDSRPVGKLLDQVLKGRWERIDSQATQLRLNLLKTRLRRPQSALLDLCRFSYGHLSDYLGRDPDTVIGFIGPDGSGKSTYSSNVLKSFEGFFDAQEYYHGQFNMFPQLKSLVPSALKPEDVEDQLQTGPESNFKDRTWKGYLLRQGLMLYYALDFILGSLLLSTRRETKLIIFDRCFYDHVIQPGPIELDDRLFSVLRRLVPTPNLVIYLYAPPELIFGRKPELEPTEIKRQASICERIVEECERAWTVDNSDSMEESEKRIRALVFDYLRSEY